MSTTYTLLTVALSAVVLITVALAWLFARLWSRPKRVAPDRTPADYGLAYEPVHFYSRGERRNGWFVPTEHARAPAIVIAHSWSRNAAQMLPLARALHEAGYAVLLYDARGHGASEGRGFITILSFVDDLWGAVDFLRDQRRDVDPNRIALVGHSMGGAAAIVAAAIDRRIRAVVSSSAFAEIPTLTRRVLRSFHLPSRLFFPLVRFFIQRHMSQTMVWASPRNRIGEVEAPLLLLHGDADCFVPHSELAALAAGADGNAETVLLPGRGHSNLMRDHRYPVELVRFLDRVLAAPARPANTGRVLAARGRRRLHDVLLTAPSSPTAETSLRREPERRKHAPLRGTSTAGP